MKLAAHQIAAHRNGISGAPFHVLIFHDGQSTKLGIVFEAASHVAVFDLELLTQQEIRFGLNSYRGDQFEPGLRRLIANFESQP